MMIAAGVLLYVLLVGRYPFYDQTAESLFKKIRKGEYTIPSRLDLSLDVRIIIHSLLRMDPSKRLATTIHTQYGSPSAMRLLRTNWAQLGAVKKMKELAPPPLGRIVVVADAVVPVINPQRGPTSSMPRQIPEERQ